MATSNRRSTPLIVIGILVFVLGTGLLVALFGDDDDNDTGATPATTPTTAAPAPGTVTAPGAPATFTIPEGRQAVALQVPFVPGVAGYLGRGNHVNVYGVFRERQPNSRIPVPLTKLVVPNVEILTVQTPTPGAGAGNVTIVVAATADEAEQLIHLQSFEAMHLTIVPEGQPAATTGGRGAANIL